MYEENSHLVNEANYSKIFKLGDRRDFVNAPLEGTMKAPSGTVTTIQSESAKAESGRFNVSSVVMEMSYFTPKRDRYSAMRSRERY